MDNVAHAANVTRYDLPRHLTVTRPNCIPHPVAIEIDEKTGHVDAICVGDNRQTVLGYSDLSLMAKWHGLNMDEVTAVLTGWAPTHRLTYIERTKEGVNGSGSVIVGTVFLVMLAGDGTGDAFTGKEWAEGDLPRWMLDEQGRWYERDGDGFLAERTGVAVEVLTGASQ